MSNTSTIIGNGRPITMSASPFGDEKTIGLELYKALRAEAASYLEKVPALWLQKLTLIGAMIAFLIAQSGKLAEKEAGGNVLLIAAVLAIPVLALLIDAKILEYGLHARAISDFIRLHSAPESIEARWESFLWGDKSRSRRFDLIHLRSATTVIVTAVPTALLIVLAGVVLDVLSQGPRPWTAAGALTAAVYFAVVVYCVVKIWPELSQRSPQAGSAPTENPTSGAASSDR